ncbi:MAG TPA: DUF2911 domain-containing protein [Gemmatimonadales bacterium]|nr:DUF2911 domain-containing protein [Gemmatimonadales bacterium]
MPLSVTLALLSLATAPTAAPAPAVADSACPVLMPDKVPVEGRESQLDSLTFTAGGRTVKLCYGRPSARGRKMIGGEAVPFGKLWRTGANEPTVVFTPVALDIAGVKVGPGKYSIYSVPNAKEWVIIVNRSTSQWGHESTYTKEVEAQEVGRGKAPVQKLSKPVETFTIVPHPASGEVQHLYLDWETTRVVVPVKAAG